MIELTEQTIPIQRLGRRPKTNDSTDALSHLARNLSPQINRALDWLAMGGVMSASRLGIPGRTLRYYQKQQLVQRLGANAQFEQFAEVFEMDKRRDSETALYCLGTLGEEIVRQRYSFPPLTGYLTYTASRILHDLILNEVVFRLAQAARKQGWRTFWAGTHAAELRSGGEQILEPDALLILENGQARKAFVIEYHNEEDKRQRAFDKVRRYERARDKPERWMSAWQVETFPPALAVFQDNAVGMGYRDAAREFQAKGTYYGKSLQGIVKGNLREWLNLTNGKKEEIF